MKQKVLFFVSNDYWLTYIFIAQYIARDLREQAFEGSVASTELRLNVHLRCLAAESVDPADSILAIMNGVITLSFKRKLAITGIVFALLVCWRENGFSVQRRGSDPFQHPQLGLWFGPVTPIYTTAEDLETYLGGGIFLRTNSFIRGVKLGFDTSYQQYRSRGVNQLDMIPVYGNLLYRLPFNFPLSFQLKAGAGGVRLETKPDRYEQWDPLFMVGFETSFPAGRVFNIGLRIDYLVAYEGFIEGASRNGHFINAGITLFFNLGR